jgi:hypothetical protein
MEIIIAIFRHGKQRKIELIGCLYLTCRTRESKKRAWHFVTSCEKRKFLKKASLKKEKMSQEISLKS